MATQYLCGCSQCKEQKFVSYTTTRRHLSVYGAMQESQQPDNKFGTNSDDDDVDYCDGSGDKLRSDCGTDSDDNVSGDEIRSECGTDSEPLFYVSDSEDWDRDDTSIDCSDDECHALASDGDDSDSDNDISDNENIQHDNNASALHWILILFFRLQHLFNISNVAAAAILSFISMILDIISHPLHNLFPKTIYRAMKFANRRSYVDIKKRTFIVCPKESCNATYDKSSGLKVCTSSPFNKVCGTSLGFERQLSFEKKKWKPFKTFYLIPPSVWLKNMCKSDEFLSLLESSTDPSRSRPNYLLDIRDGNLWHEFEDFFSASKYNFGLMLNVDFFKPFKRSEYKVGGIFITVLNLPREDRFKKKWTMLVGIIPGPHEPPIHVNNYLKPLVDDLLQLWKGVPLNSESSRCIRAALIAVAADLPAIRKVTQFLGHKADLGCPKCKFAAKREPGTSGASGRMCYFTSSPAVSRSHQEVVSQASTYQQAATKAEAGRIAQANGVRYSELMRLPYFDIVRMSTVDPMHTFLLGMVKKETKLNFSFLSRDERCEFTRRLKSMKLPYDIGRLPNSMFDNDTLEGATADQWKIYITVCARACMYKLLPKRAYQCLVLLSEIVVLVSDPVLNEEDIRYLRDLLQQHHNIFCRVYGKWEVTINYHMSLHIPEIIADFGPPNAFWCFSYERLNGTLIGFPHSNRSVELDVTNRFMKDFSFATLNLPAISDLNFPTNLKDLAPEFTSPNDGLYVSSFPLTSFTLVSLRGTRPEERFEKQMMLDRGDVEDWPIEFRHPCRRNVKVDDTLLTELKKFFEDLYGDSLDYIKPRITKYGRCFVNGQRFSSTFNSTDRGSIIKAMYVDISNELIPYFGVVKYFFTISIIVSKQPKQHFLSYVTWLKLKFDHPDTLSKLFVVTKNFYVSDRIISPRRFLCRCIVAPYKVGEESYFVSELLK